MIETDEQVMPHSQGAYTWRCFHCGDVFTEAQEAEDHFGIADGIKPLCLVVDRPSQALKLMADRGWMPPGRAAAIERRCETAIERVEMYQAGECAARQEYEKMGGAKNLWGAVDNFDNLQFSYQNFLNVPPGLRWLVRVVAWALRWRV